MNNIYTIAIETNDNGWVICDKMFQTNILAIKYMRKVVARNLINLRRCNINITYLNIYKDNDGNDIIQYGYLVDNEYTNIDIRIKDMPVFMNENDFKLFPIQF